MKTCAAFLAGASLLSSLSLTQAEIKVVSERNASGSGGFEFKNVPAPSKTDAGGAAKFSLVEGTRDRNGGGLGVLQDGRLPRGDDEPSSNFFFGQGTEGGRLVVDLGAVTEVKQVNTYSWHSATRGPQVYKLYAADGKAEGFNAEPKKAVEPDKAGWKLIASVDTRPKDEDYGGQYGVSIRDSEGAIGNYRYLLLDVSRTEDKDPFGNTFFSEIDVVDPKEHTVAGTSDAPKENITKAFEADGGKYKFTIDVSAAPDLKEWAFNELSPVVTNWYPKLVAMLPSEGYSAPTNLTILFREDMGGTPASAGGSRINCNIGWFRKNLKGEARGSVVHEMVHIVQQYGWGRRNSNAARTPGWLTEGIPDYIRWFIYEPQTRGAEISKDRFTRAKYDASYRVTGNFLNWVTLNKSSNIVQVLNAAARQGKYSEDIWKEQTGKTVQELGHEWKMALAAKLGIDSAADTEFSPKNNALSEAEKKAGWKLLFNGKDL